MKLDCLLIHVPKLNNHYNLFGKHMYCMFMPMGLFAIADYINRDGHKVKILHLGLEKIRNKKFSLQEYIHEANPKTIGLSLHWHHQSYDVIEVAREIKRAKPNIFIILGGFTASYFDSEIMEKFSFIDAIIRGDGEIPFADFLTKKSSGNANVFSDVPNLTWRNKDGQIVENEIQYVAKDEDLGKLNFVNLKLLENHELYIKYARDPFIWINGLNKRINSIVLDKNSFFPLSIMRGCDVNCSFCGGSKISCTKTSNRHKQVFLPIKKILDSLEELKTYGYETIFIDLPPLIDSYYLDNLLKEIKNRRIKIGCIASFRGLPSDDLLKKFADTFELKKSKIFLSPETSSENTRALNKGHYFSNEELLETITHSIGLGIYTELYFVMGLPFETSQSLKETKIFQEFLRKRFGKKICIYTDFLALEPGSPMYISPEKFGIIKTWNCFMDFYCHHSGQDKYSWPNLGYYSEVFLQENISDKSLNKERVFRNELEKIHCEDFCRLANFFTLNCFIRIKNKFALKAVFILSRLICKMMKCYWRVVGDVSIC